MHSANAMSALSGGVATRNQVLLALGVSVALHFVVFQAWPRMQGSWEQIIVVDAELIAPTVTEEPPKPPPPMPEPEPEPAPSPKPESVNSKTAEPPQKQAKPDTGVALPVIAEQAASASANDYVVADVPPLTAEDKLPFGSRTGTVPLADYTPSDAPPADAKPADPDADDEVDAGALGTFAQGLRDKASQLGSYPAIALKRGWQGTVKVLVKFNIDGTPRHFSIAASSGHKVLDDQALEMVRLACGDIAMPSQLNGKRFSVVVPVDFRISS